MTTAGPERTAVDTLISGTVIIERSENSVRTFPPESDDSNSVVIERIGPPRTTSAPSAPAMPLPSPPA